MQPRKGFRSEKSVLLDIVRFRRATAVSQADILLSQTLTGPFEAMMARVSRLPGLLDNLRCLYA